jgi:hypothetical protein
MTPAQLNRAEFLYRRFKTETLEYRRLAESLGIDTGELNRRIWHVLHDRRQARKDGSQCS